MSVQAITWALDQTCATATEKAVLLVVSNYVGPDGTTWVGQETIATQACCSIKTVERALSAFETAGWITRERRHRKDGSRTSDLIISHGPKHPERRENELTDRKSDRRPPNRHPVQTKQTTSPNLPDSVSGLTSFEPLEEPLGEAAADAREPVRQIGSTAVVDDWPVGLALDHAHALSREAETIRLDPARQPGLIQTLGRLSAWKRDGASWNHDVLPVVTVLARKQGPPIKSWKFFDDAIAQSISDNRQALTLPEAQTHAGQAHVIVPDHKLAAKRANLGRHLAGAERASELMAARRNL